MIVAWDPPKVAAGAEPVRAGVHVLAFVIGGAVPALVASAGWWLGVPYVATVAALGIPIGAALATLAARRLAGPDWVATALLLGFGAPLVPGLLIAGSMLLAGIASTAEEGVQGLAAGLAMAFIVAVVALVAGGPVTLPTAVVAGLLVHRAAAMAPTRARVHTAVLVAVAGVASIASLASAQGAVDVDPVDWAEVRAAVRLTTTFENHTDRERVVDVGWLLPDGETGSIVAIPPCSVVTHWSALEGAAWRIVETDGEWSEPAGVPLVTSDAFPGTDPALTVVFAADGSVGVRAGARDADPRAPEGDAERDPERIPGCR